MLYLDAEASLRGTPLAGYSAEAGGPGDNSEAGNPLRTAGGSYGVKVHYGERYNFSNRP
jgi:hypothetical protein